MTSLGADWHHDKPVIVGAMVYLICCKYLAHPPAPWSSTAKGSADTVLDLMLQYVRCFTYHGPCYEVLLRWTCPFYSWHASRSEAETTHLIMHKSDYATRKHTDSHQHIVLTFINPYPTAFPYGNGMVLHFYQQQESSTTKIVHKVINKGLKTYV